VSAVVTLSEQQELDFSVVVTDNGPGRWDVLAGGEFSVIAGGGDLALQTHFCAPPAPLPEPELEPEPKPRALDGLQLAFPKESRRRRWARKSKWLKGAAAGYLDIGQYYRVWSGTQGYTMEFCQRSWSVYRKGDDRQLRGHGCKERVWCPGCCVYHRDTLAKEAAETVLLGIEALEISEGLRTSHFGLKVVCTMPKETSVWIDGAGNRPELLNALFHAKQSFLRKWLGKGVGGVSGLDFVGESNPVEANYHANSYVFPAKRSKAGWVEVPKWVDTKGLLKLRKLWAQELRVHLGETAPGLAGLEEANLWVNYLKGSGQVHHFLRYLYRSPLYDLWKGWQSRVPMTGLSLVDAVNKGYEVGGIAASYVNYEFWKGGKVQKLRISAYQVSGAFRRVADLPAKFKRVRWFGCFSDGQRKSTMESLGLVADDVDREKEDTEEWVQESGPYILVRYRKAGEGGGLLLRHRDTGVIYKSEELAAVVNYAPEGVLTGKRQRWRRPGARDGPGRGDG